MEEIYLPSESQRLLLRVSRQTLEDFVRDGAHPITEISDPHLRAMNYGAFVSLHKGSELRGCVGTCNPTRPLFETIIEMTKAAASRDRRVPPVSEDEVRDIQIEITVLSPLEKTSDPLSLEAGRHGLQIICGDRVGVLLPQVATEYGWDMDTLLAQTCCKAGLPEDAWQWPDVQVSSFTALIIEEEK